MPVLPYPVSASAAYYFDPAEDARRVAAIQARIQAGIAAERAATRARAQKRSRSGGGRSQGSSRNEQPRATDQGRTSTPPRQGYVSAPPNQPLADPRDVPEQGYVSAPPNQSFTNYGGVMDPGYTSVPPAPAPAPASAPVVTPEQALSASERLLYPPSPAPYVAPDSALSDSQALYDRVGPQMPDGYTPVPEAPYRGRGFTQSGAPAYSPQYDPAFPTAPPRVVTPEQALAASEGMMQPRYLNMSVPPAAYSQDQALVGSGGALDQGYTSVPPAPAPQLVVTPEQALAASEGMMQPRYLNMSVPPAAYSQDQALVGSGGALDQGYTSVPPAPQPVVTPEQAMAASEGMMQPRYLNLNMSVPPAVYSQDQALVGSGGALDQGYTSVPPAVASQPVVTPEQAMAASEGMMQPRYTGATTAASSGLGALWSMVRSAVADALSGADAGIRRWGDQRTADPRVNLWGNPPEEPRW